MCVGFVGGFMLGVILLVILSIFSLLLKPLLGLVLMLSILGGAWYWHTRR